MRKVNEFIYKDTFYLSGILERNGVSNEDHEDIISTVADKDVYTFSYYKDDDGVNFRYIYKNDGYIQWQSVPFYVRDRVWDFEEKTKVLN